MQKMEIKRTSSGLSVVVGCQSGNLTIEEAKELGRLLIRTCELPQSPILRVSFGDGSVFQDILDGDVVHLNGRFPGLWFTRNGERVAWNNGGSYISAKGDPFIKIIG